MKESSRFGRDLELHETHLSIRTTLRWIGAELDPPAGRKALGAESLLEALGALCSDLERHFEIEEQGVFPFARSRGEAPGPGELERWRAEHRALVRDLREILAELEGAVRTGATVPEGLRPALRSWFAALARHEEAESAPGGS